MSESQCIYCERSFDQSCGEGDHILQAGVFGEFRGDQTFRGLCTKCNNEFGAFEQQLAQASPLGFFRNVVRPNRGRRGKRGSGVQRGTRAAPAPKHTMDINGHKMLVRPSADDPLTAFPVDQLLVVDASGCEHAIQLFRGMSAADLRSKIAEVGGLTLQGASFECDLVNAEFFQALFAEAYPIAKVIDSYVVEPGEFNRPGRVEFYFTDGYFRALAKTALHYYLVRNRRGLRGSEEMFAAVKDFIRFGGEKDAFFHSSGRTFSVPFGKTTDGGAITPNSWFHLLASDESRDVVVVYMLLFAGPGHVPNPIYVTLGRLPSEIVVPSGVWGHQFCHDAQPTGKFAGQVLDISLTRKANLTEM